MHYQLKFGSYGHGSITVQRNYAAGESIVEFSEFTAIRQYFTHQYLLAT